MKFQNISGKYLAMTGASEFLPILRLHKISSTQVFDLVKGGQMFAYLHRALKYKCFMHISW